MQFFSNEAPFDYVRTGLVLLANVGSTDNWPDAGQIGFALRSDSCFCSFWIRCVKSARFAAAV